MVAEPLVEGTNECLACAAERVGKGNGTLTGFGVVC
jgi:hypothetical protein